MGGGAGVSFSCELNDINIKWIINNEDNFEVTDITWGDIYDSFYVSWYSEWKWDLKDFWEPNDYFDIKIVFSCYQDFEELLKEHLDDDQFEINSIDILLDDIVINEMLWGWYVRWKLTAGEDSINLESYNLNEENSCIHITNKNWEKQDIYFSEIDWIDEEDYELNVELKVKENFVNWFENEFGNNYEK